MGIFPYLLYTCALLTYLPCIYNLHLLPVRFISSNLSDKYCHVRAYGSQARCLVL